MNKVKQSVVLTKEKNIEAQFGKREVDKFFYFKNRKRKRSHTLFSFLVVSTLTVFLFRQIFHSPLWRLESYEIQNLTHKSQVEIPPMTWEVKPVIKYVGGARNKSSPIKVFFESKSSEIPLGTEAKATLISGGSNGLIKARLTTNIKSFGTSLFDAGSTLIGIAVSTERRLFIKFTRLVTSDGKKFQVSAQAFDLEDQILGIKGVSFKNSAARIATNAALNFVSGYGNQNFSNQNSIFGSTQQMTDKQRLLQGSSQAASDEIKRQFELEKEEAPAIEVKSGTEFLVIFDQEEK